MKATLLLRIRVGTAMTKLWLSEFDGIDDFRFPNCSSIETIKVTLQDYLTYSTPGVKLLEDSSFLEAILEELIYPSGTRNFLKNQG